MTPGRRTARAPAAVGVPSPSGGRGSRARSFLIAPTYRGWGVLLLGAICWLAWTWLDLRELLLLALFLLVPVPIALAAATAVAFLSRPRVVLDAIALTPTVGERVAVGGHILVHSTFLSDAEVLWRWGRDVGAREGQMVDRVRLRPGSNGTPTGVVLRVGRRGMLMVTPVSLRVTDPLGLARFWLRLGAGAELLVLPELMGPGELPDALGTLGSRGARLGSGEPGGNLRDYRTGDAPRTIHWKQSARQGRLLVNVPEGGKDTSQQLVLVDDRGAYPGAGEDGATTEAFERAVSVAATLVTTWLGGGGEVVLTLTSSTVPPLASREASTALRLLAQVTLQPDAADRHGEALPAGCLLVSGTLTAPLRATMARSVPGVLVLTDGGTSATGTALPEGWRLARMAPVEQPDAGSGAPGTHPGAGHRVDGGRVLASGGHGDVR